MCSLPARWLRCLGLVVGGWLVLGSALGAELRVLTDFEGGSGKVESIDQEAGVIKLMPGGDPQRGWPCWWFVRIEGAEKDRLITIKLSASDRPVRNNGVDTGKPLTSNWALPIRASFSLDREHWEQTEPGHRDGASMLYSVQSSGGAIWVAWGPAFTPQDTATLIKRANGFTAFQLATSREGRSIQAMRMSPPAKAERTVWIQGRQHAWEVGGSWVACGVAEWLASDDPEAVWMRAHAEVVIVPIMDVDNVVTGNGGKEESPRDHNRDWAETPIFPEVAAAQGQLKTWAKAGGVDCFVDLHNPAPGDFQPFFYVSSDELLDEVTRANRSRFLKCAVNHIVEPLRLDSKTRMVGPGYHPLWRQICSNWVTTECDPSALSICLETSFNTPNSGPAGYRKVGAQLGQALVEYLRGLPAR